MTEAPLAQLALMTVAITAVLAVIVAGADRLLPVNWIRERHHIACAVLVAVPLLFIVMLLPEERPADVASSVHDTSIASIARAAVAPTAQDQLPRAWQLAALAEDSWRLAWLSFSAVLALRLLRALVAILALRRRSAPARLLEGLTLSRKTPLRSSPEASSPLLIGYWRPAIVLPAGFEPSTRTLPVLEHEVAHAIRGDNWISLGTGLLHVVMWWNLPLRPVLRILERTREELCDDHAVAVTRAPRALAEALLDVAASALRNRHVLASATTNGEMESRLRRLLSGEALRARKSRPVFFLCAPLILALLAMTPRLGLLPDARAGETRASGRPLLIDAVTQGDADTVAQTLHAGANPDTRDTRGEPALAIALNGQRMRIAQQLLVAGADPDIRDTAGDTPLAAAVRRGDEAAVSLLVLAGADPLQPGTDGHSAIALAARAPGRQIDAMLKQSTGAAAAPGRVQRWVPPRTARDADCTPLDTLLLGECYRFTDTDGPVPAIAR